ncbi:baseplate J/gp47 family protein [Bergeriella denitrificans]|uniref:Baseplate J-like protein n=1 Tax=Bergeriella denitrificans TaxID=494 RepID=A0A378UDX5_BERDE|nr:baseplate J/gp47 family protein [Bergeriella denitrificans]STZ75576.1 baseplate J-like protein [Bergeriella denitrificans]
MFQTPTFEEIREAILRDTRSLDPTADTSADSDHFVHASRLASCAVGQYAHQVWVVRQIFPDTADTEYLERHASLRGLRRRSPTTAAGVAVLFGNGGAQVPAGLQIKQGNRFYRTTAAGQIAGDGQVSVAITADDAGESYNVSDASAQLMAPPAGVSADCRISAAGGTDAESDASLLARLLEIIRRPPAGGNRHDYKNWALSVDGVTSAYVYPLRRGLGTVDIAITSAGGVPSDEIVQAVQAYIDEMRPVTAKSSLVLKPDVTNVPVAVQVKVDGMDLQEAQSRIEAALLEYFDALIPGDGLIVSQIEAVISNVGNITDRRVSSPSANRDADTVSRIEWFKLGRVTVSLM